MEIMLEGAQILVGADVDAAALTRVVKSLIAQTIARKTGGREAPWRVMEPRGRLRDCQALLRIHNARSRRSYNMIYYRHHIYEFFYFDFVENNSQHAVPDIVGTPQRPLNDVHLRFVPFNDMK